MFAADYELRTTWIEGRVIQIGAYEHEEARFQEEW